MTEGNNAARIAGLASALGLRFKDEGDGAYTLGWFELHKADDADRWQPFIARTIRSASRMEPDDIDVSEIGEPVSLAEALATIAECWIADIRENRAIAASEAALAEEGLL